MNKFIIIKNLLLQKSKILNERFKSKIYTLMHVIARKENEYFQNIVKFLMSENRISRADMHARTLNERTSLKTTFSRYMINAKSIYSLLSSRDQDSLNFDYLLNIIVNNKNYNVNFKIHMIRTIIINNKIEMTNARNSFYNVIVNNVEKNENQKFTKMIMTI